MITPEELAQIIDHTNVKPDATDRDIHRLCEECLEFNFSSACVTPAYVSLASKILKESDVGVCVVVGFPLGANKSETKVFETSKAVKEGATEIDMVMSIGKLKSGKDEQVMEEIESVVKAADGRGVKVILETALLTQEEKVRACLASKYSGAAMVKTSTGVSYPGASVEDVSLLRETVGREMGVKASGGIRDLSTALEMIQAGASRIGTSTGPQIIRELL